MKSSDPMTIHTPVRSRAQSRSALVATVLYDGFCTFEFGVAVEVFGLPRPDFGPDWYRFTTCAAEPGPLRAVGGIEVVADGGLERLAEADIIVIPGWRDPEVDPPVDLIDALKAAHARGARLVSLCSGLFVLAATGLLEGKRVTTHWLYADALRRRYPALQFDPDVLYIDQGQILTSAGTAAAIDLALHVVRRDHGPALANRLACRLVAPAHRNGGQRQYLPRVVPAREDARLSELLAHLQQNYTQTITIAEMAGRAAMSERSLNRRFLETVGMSPSAWLASIRVNRARELLEEGDCPIERLTDLSGFGSPAALRHHFRRKLGISPDRLSPALRPRRDYRD